MAVAHLIITILTLRFVLVLDTRLPISRFIMINPIPPGPFEGGSACGRGGVCAAESDRGL